MTTDTTACRTLGDDPRLSARWNLAGDSGSQGLDTGCRSVASEIVALADAIENLADRLYGIEAESNWTQ